MYRISLWFILLGFTVLILIYPVGLRLTPTVLWSADIFPNLPIFATLFYLWALVLMILLFVTSDGRKVKWERMVLVAIASLVLRGFWNIIVPVQGQAYSHATATKIWQNFGRVIPHPGVGGYINWPGVSLINYILSQITGLELFSSIAILTIFIAVIIGVITYVFMLGLLKSTFSASLASLLIILGNLALVIYHTAGPTAIIFVVLFLVMLFKEKGINSPSSLTVVLILLMGAVVTHLPSAANLFFFFLGIYILALLKRRQFEFKPSITILFLLFIIPFAWSSYWTPSTFRELSQWSVTGLPRNPAVSSAPSIAPPIITSLPVTSAPQIVASPVNSLPIRKWFNGAFTMWKANFGEIAPLWYRLIRLFWLVLLYIIGGLLWVWNLKKFRRLSSVESKLSTVFFGLVMMNVLSSLVSPRGSGELQRGLTYIPFFTVPLLMLFLYRLKPVITKVAIAGLTAMLITFCLPTFLATNPRINILNPHLTEYLASKWLHSLYGTGQRLDIFVTHPMAMSFTFHLFDARITTDHEAESAGYTQESRWRAMYELINNYTSATQNENPSFFIDSPKMAVVSAMSFGILVDHPHWKEITGYLSNKNRQIYDNGPIQIYAH